MGSFSFSRFDRFTGKAALQALTVYAYNKSDKGVYDKTMLGLGTIGIWMPWARRQVAGFGGWGIKRLLLAAVNPVSLTVTFAYVGGAIASDTIDPEEGLDNYVGFTLGGVAGGNDANYLTGDANNSGYFNVTQNMDAIFESNRSKLEAAVQRQAEQAYIDAYWEAKAVSNFESMIMIYNELTPAQQNKIQNEIRDRYWILR